MLAELRIAWGMRNLLLVMVSRDVKARYAGTVAGIAWVYFQPLVTVAVYYLVFDIVFGLRMGEGSKATAAGTYLIVGMVPWAAFSEGLSRTTNSLIDAASLLQKNAIPPVLVVLRSTLASAAVYLPLLAMLAVLYTPLHGWRSALLALPVLVVLQFLMVYMLGHTLAILAAALRDTVQMVGFLLSVGIFLSPILFPASMFPEDWRWVLYANPMTAWVQGYQAVLLQGAWPSVNAWAGMIGWLLLALVVLRPVVRRSREELVDWL